MISDIPFNSIGRTPVAPRGISKSTINSEVSCYIEGKRIEVNIGKRSNYWDDKWTGYVDSLNKMTAQHI